MMGKTQDDSHLGFCSSQGHVDIPSLEFLLFFFSGTFLCEPFPLASR